MPYATEADRAAALDVLERHKPTLSDEEIVILIRLANSVLTNSNLGSSELRMARVVCERLLGAERSE
ncbi:hypothetical protein ABIE65_005479 [Constrictibacter sp. MBR-5]|jgi:hypothetical protein|uniref:hypothetical protein n=1 Tax=Constrictibacter sp. MBR-5 TaxID=3156467 RepID=UPI00339AE6BE